METKWINHGNEGSVIGKGGLMALFTDCELRKGKVGGVRMTQKEITKYRNKQESYYFYACPECIDYDKVDMNIKQLLRFDLNARKGDCIDCGVIELPKWMTESTIYFNDIASKDNYIAGRRAHLRHHRPITRAYTPQKEQFTPSLNQDICGDGCGCPMDETGNPTKYNNYHGIIYDVGTIEGMNHLGPNGEYVLKDRHLKKHIRLPNGEFTESNWVMPADEVFVKNMGWIKTQIIRRENNAESL